MGEPRRSEWTRSGLAAGAIAAVGFVLATSAHARPLGDLDGSGAVALADARVALDRSVRALPFSIQDATVGDVAPGTVGEGGAFTPAGDGAVDTGDAVVLLLGAAGTYALPAGDVAFPVTIEILAPADGVFVLQDRPAFQVRYAAAGAVDLSTLAFEVEGATAAVDPACAPGATTASCAPVDALPQGEVTIRAFVRDTEGNAADDYATFTVDTAPVAVAITAPADGAITTDASLLVRGTVGAEAEGVSVDGVAAVVAGGVFSATVPLREGANAVVAVATKASGLVTTATVEVTRDPFAPIVRIEAPADGATTTGATAVVAGVVNDVVTGGVEPRVFVNGVEASVERGAFMVPDLPLRRGPNQLLVWAVDAAGNEGTDAVQVTRAEAAGPRIRVVGGNGQTGAASALLADPLAVAVEDAAGNPLFGRVVIFETTRGDGRLSADGAEPFASSVRVGTTSAGMAEARFRLGTGAGGGANRVRARVDGVDGGVDLCFTAVAGAPDKALMSAGDNQRGAAGHPLPIPLEALVVDADGNPVPGVELTFTVVRGGGWIDGAASTVRTTRADGIARAIFTLGTDEGTNGQAVATSFAGMPEGAGASFVATALASGAPAETRFAGIVLDNTQTAIPGATVSIDGAPAEALTDAEGRFEIAEVPVGHVHLHIDPSTSPRPETFPPLAFEIVTVAGRTNALPMPILIPPLQPANTRVVGGDEDATLTIEGVPGFEVTVFARSVTFGDGSTVGPVSINQVHLDKVPMPPPSGSLFIPPAWTVQPAGTAFDPPARVAMPNLGLAPGRTIELYQFDHDLFRFITIGKATVTADGARIVSDPGFGITRAGWGGGGAPAPPTTCASNCDDGNPCTSDSCQVGFCVHINLDGPAPTQTSGDCMQNVCDNGSLMMEVDDTDEPPQASPTDCMRQTCEDGSPMDVCDDGETPDDPANTDTTDCIRVACDSCAMVIQCEDSDVPSAPENDDTTDCVKIECDDCSMSIVTALDDTPSQEPLDDCLGAECQAGSLFPIITDADNEDPPEVAITDDCRDYFCADGNPQFQPNSFETPPQIVGNCMEEYCCSVGGGSVCSQPDPTDTPPMGTCP